MEAADDIARDAFIEEASSLSLNKVNLVLGEESKLHVPHESICHTARLPAQTRYLGYLTDTRKVGGPSVYGEETYEIGIEADTVRKQPPIGELALVWSAAQRENCSVALAPGKSVKIV
jgi:hypothetical protein